jgi:hypothetical protein
LRFAEFIARRAVAGVLLFVAACGDDAPLEIKEVREGPATTGFTPVPTAERFGMAASGQNPHHGMQAAPAAPGATQFEWTTPEGWQEMPPTQMRQANFRLERDPKVECYLSEVQGGIAANVMRWRKQMGLEPISPAAVAALPKEAFLGQGGILVDLEGAFAGMGQGEPRPGYRMLGLLIEEPGRTVTLKMTGPAATVAEEKERFLGLAKSFRAQETPPEAPKDDSRLAWDAPPEWEIRKGHEMREVTFAPRGSEGVECYVTILSGGAGGLEANLTRWSGQMGQPPLVEAEIAALETVRVLGRDAKLIDVTGAYTDMQGNKFENAGLLGLVCPVEGALVTVKMTGPKDVVAREKDRFLTFCRSLRAR